MLNIDLEKRAHSDSISEDLIEPFRSLIEAGMKRVREGIVIDSSKQVVTLRGADRIFQITNVHVRKTRSQQILLSGYLGYGLVIDGIQVDKPLGEPLLPVRELDAIQIPRSTIYATKQDLYHLRGADPEAVTKLVEQLNDATLSSDTEYSRLLSIIRARRRATFLNATSGQS